MINGFSDDELDILMEVNKQMLRYTAIGDTAGIYAIKRSIDDVSNERIKISVLKSRHVPIGVKLWLSDH